MAFKLCVTVIAAVYAMQLICHADKDYGDSNETSLEESDYEGSCLYPVLHTLDNKTLAINCTANCNDGDTKIINETIPCVNMTTPPLNYSLDVNYTCTVGTCDNGTCPSNGTKVLCWL
uniref:Evasin n=1 Tax=Rhipicephalus zambeziensis TaxID=60191 RepID=A0A224YCA7_9ACAR